MQAGKVATEIGLAVQVDVEGQEVDELPDVEVLGRREVGIAHERGRSAVLHDVGERAHEFPHPLRAVPADDVGRDLVTDQKPEKGRMTAAVLRRRAHRAADLGDDVLAIEKADVLRPRDRDEHPDATLGRPVEEPARRHRERSEAVRADLDHEREVTLEDVVLREGEAVRGGRERPVRDAPEVELVVTDEEEFPADGGRPAVEHGQRCPLR